MKVRPRFLWQRLGVVAAAAVCTHTDSRAHTHTYTHGQTHARAHAAATTRTAPKPVLSRTRKILEATQYVSDAAVTLPFYGAFPCAYAFSFIKANFPGRELPRSSGFATSPGVRIAI